MAKERQQKGEDEIFKEMAMMGEFKVIDAHMHAGFEKKGIKDRPGVSQGLWLTKEGMMSKEAISIRKALGDPNPFKPLKNIDEMPEFSVDTWIKIMDAANVEMAVVMGMDTTTDPPYNFPWHVPMEYIKEEFLDKHPERFVAIAGINLRAEREAVLDQVTKAKELGFLGVKVHTPSIGYPNDRERCYPVYEKCLELDLHVEIHTGVEAMPGARAKYQDPVYVDDVAVDFPKLKIVQLHCGIMNNPRVALWNVIRHPNVYTDISIPHPTLMEFSFYHNLDMLRFIETVVPHKVFFGSDFPLLVSIYRECIDHIKLLPLSPQFKRALLRDNAYKFFNLEKLQKKH